MTENNRQLVSMVLAVVIEGFHDKSLEEAASGLIIGLGDSLSPDVFELAVLGLKTMVRHEFRDMVANRHWQLRHKETEEGGTPQCKECRETKFLQPDPAGDYCDARTASGAPLLCTNPACSRGRRK